MGLKLGKRLGSKRCKWDREWNVYECGNAHGGLFGRLSCSQCGNTGVVCASARHPANKKPYDC